MNKIALFAVLAFVSASSVLAGAEADGSSDKCSSFAFGIGIPDLHERPNFRANSLIWPESETPVCGLDLTVLCGYRKGVKGVQIGGLVASSEEMKGLCLGCADLVFNDFRGAMIGGYGAIANGYAKGAMIAGAFSFVRELDGAQISGALNWALSGEVFQLGCINYAGSAKCVQIGLINLGSEGLRFCPLIRAHW